jgi:hypothetical protein
MLASMALLLGVAVGLIVLATVGRARGTGPELGSWVLALGALATAAFVATALIQRHPEVAAMAAVASIALAFSTVLVGIGALRRGARGPATWLGLALGGLPALAWIAFLVGNLLGIGG